MTMMKVRMMMMMKMDMRMAMNQTTSPPLLTGTRLRLWQLREMVV